MNSSNGIEAVVWYLGHSGWAVKTSSHFLIFDYTGKFQKKTAKKLSDGRINLDEIKDENVFVFVSHKHHDHYDKSILEWKYKIPGVNYVFGWKGITSGRTHHLSGREKTKIEDLKISTINSTDTGVAFLVKVDGLYVFHAGDHANWEDEPTDNYTCEIDFIAGGNRVDVAFLPVTTFSGIRQKDITEGVFYAIEKLKPRYMFPMHGNGREYIYREFAKDAENLGLDTDIICAERPGDKYDLNFPL